MTESGPTLAGVVVCAAARPHPDERVNGDAWRAWTAGATCRVAVVDGLGHGPLAAAAAQAALASLDASTAEPLTAALLRCHAALTQTRGAAVSLAEIDVAHGSLTFAGVGNVEARLWAAAAPRQVERPLVYRGVVGGAVPRVRAFTHSLPAGWRLVIHSDGVSARFDLVDLPQDAAPQAIADLLLERWARSTDDATVVVVAPA